MGVGPTPRRLHGTLGNVAKAIGECDKAFYAGCGVRFGRCSTQAVSCDDDGSHIQWIGNPGPLQEGNRAA